MNKKAELMGGDGPLMAAASEGRITLPLNHCNSFLSLAHIVTHSLSHCNPSCGNTTPTLIILSLVSYSTQPYMQKLLLDVFSNNLGHQLTPPPLMSLSVICTLVTMFSNYQGHVNIVNFLLTHGARTNVNDKDESDRTALYLSASRGHLIVVQALASQGADVNMPCKDGRTALVVSAGNTIPPSHTHFKIPLKISY